MARFAKLPITMILLMMSALALRILASHLLANYAAVAAPVHRWCLNSIPASKHPEFYRSMICGELGHKQNPDIESLTELGMIHLVMLTAHHLRLLDWLLQSLLNRSVKFFSCASSLLPNDSCKFAFQTMCERALRELELRPARSILRMIVITTLVLMGGAKIYLVRAWISVLLSEMNGIFMLGWRPVQMVFLSGLLSLCLVQTEAEARSLAIGWAAGLAFALAASFARAFDREKILVKLSSLRSVGRQIWEWIKAQLAIFGTLYLFLMPLLLAHGWLNLFVILTNSCLSPLLSPLFLPLALLGWRADWLRPAIDRLLSQIFDFLNVVNQIMPAGFHPTLTQGWLSSGFSRMIYVLGLSFLALTLEDLLRYPARLARASIDSRSQSTSRKNKQPPSPNSQSRKWARVAADKQNELTA